jgi:hypothetical protein
MDSLVAAASVTRADGSKVIGVLTMASAAGINEGFRGARVETSPEEFDAKL